MGINITNKLHWPLSESKIKYVRVVTGMLLYLSLIFNCSPRIAAQSKSELPNDIHVAFAGGGWRAHTGHSAWVMSLLTANKNSPGGSLSSVSGNPKSLESAFSNVKTISANSGGSWFSTMLMYDADFVNEITSSEAMSNWGSTDNTNPMQGWLGKQKNYFEAHQGICDTEDPFLQKICMTMDYLSAATIAFSWDDLVKNAVFMAMNGRITAL